MDYALLVIVGVLAGLLGGLLGIGGSSIMLPAMVLIFGTYRGGVDQIHQYQAAAMIVNFVLIWPSVAAHLRNRAVWWRVWVWMAPAALVAVVAGVLVSYLFRGNQATYLRWGVGAFFVYVAIDNVRRLIRGRKGEGLDRAAVEGKPAWRKLAVGAPMGFLAGLLGIGGGSLAVPGQQLLLKAPLRNAIANSAATIASIAWLGAIVKNARLGEAGTVGRSLILAGCLAPTAMIGSYFGGHLTHKLPLGYVRIAFIGLMLFSAAKMFGLV
jgi:hypothetical protein